MGMSDFIYSYSHTECRELPSLLDWSDLLDTKCWIHHRSTWSQTPVFRPRLKSVPMQNVITNMLRHHRFKVGGSKK